MIEEGMLQPVNILPFRKSIVLSDPTIMLVHHCENRGTCLSVTGEDIPAERWWVTANNVLFLGRVTLAVQEGTFVYRRVKMDTLAKLLAFIDLSSEIPGTASPRACFFTYPLENNALFRSQNETEMWFLTGFLRHEEWFTALRQLLRKTETYGLVKYLVIETASHSSLHSLCGPYGLSYSHFRRLCRNALGNRVKAEMCHWRLARAVLEVLEGKNDVTTIAYKYGYSSSSHFSTEVKTMMGKTLKEMRHQLDVP